MGVARRAMAVVGAVLALATVVAAPVGAAPSQGAPPGSSLGEEVGDRYDLAGGCFAIRVGEPGGYVRRGGGGFTASAATPGEAEPFRLKDRKSTRLNSSH